jgi:hypothetical protein
MAGILRSAGVTRQAQIAAKRLFAEDFNVDVERLRESNASIGSSIPGAKLVATQLEMVRPGWLFQHRAVIHRFCRFGCLNRIQRSKIDRRLQRCADSG